MNYGVTLRAAWAMVKRHKVLWLFGLLAALGGGGFNFTWSIGNQNQTLFELPLGTRALLRYVFHTPDLSGTLIGVGLVLGVIVFVTHTFAAGALIELVGTIERRQPITVRAGWRAGKLSFRPLLIMRLVLAVPLLIVGWLAFGDVLPALSSFFAAPIGERLFTLSLIERLAGGGALVIATGLIVSAISVGAARAIVLDGQSVTAAIRRGVKLMIVELPAFLVLTVLFTIIGVVISILFAVLLAPVAFLSMLPSIGANVSGFDAFMFTGDSFGPMAIVTITLALIFGTFTSAFTSAVWTLAYRQWQTHERLDDEEPDETFFTPPVASQISAGTGSN